MSKTLATKKVILSTIKDKIENSKTCIFLKQNQITGDESVTLRKNMHNSSANVFCLKNSLLRKALEEKKFSMKKVNGSLLMITGNEDLALLNEVYKNTKKIIGLDICASIIDKSILDDKLTIELGKYKTKNDLITSTLMSIKSPLLKLDNLLEKIIASKTAE